MIHPDSSAALLQSQNINTLTDLRLNVEITTPDGKAAELEEAVRSVFPYTPFAADSNREIRAMNAEEQLAEQKMVLALVEVVLLALALLSFFLSATGILALSHLRSMQSRASRVMLRIQGMSQKDGVLFALYESLLFLLPSNLIGIFGGYAIFQGIIRQMTGIAPAFGIANPILPVTALKTILLSGTTMFLCLQWNYRELFLREIMDMRREQQTSHPTRWGNTLYLLMCVLFFSALTTAVLQIGVHDAVLPLPVLLSFGLNLGVITAFCLLLALLYGLFRLCTAILRVLRIPLRGIGTLSYRLVLKRKTYTSLIGTALITGLTVLLLMYNVSSGIDAYFDRVWQDVLGYSASASSMDGSTLRPLLDAQGLPYTTVYRKLFYATNIPEGTNAAPYYQVAVFDDTDGSGAGMHVEPGTFLANEHFLFCNQIEVGDSYSFFDGIPLKCAREITNLHTTGGLSTVTFSAVLSYIDAQAHLDETYSEDYLFNLTYAETQRLAALGQQHGFSVTTAKLYADGLRGAYANYVVLLYLICVLLGLTIIVFLFSLTYVVVWKRRREFTIYRTFGASQRQVEGIILVENLYIATIAALATMMLASSGFKAAMEALASASISYTMPIWVTIATVLCATLLILMISLGVVKIFRFGEPSDTLRAEE